MDPPPDDQWYRDRECRTDPPAGISFILILLGTLTALHYRERTAAQFIFSTALVVVMLLALALPDNPLNLLTRLAVGTAGREQWVVLGGTIVIILGLGYVTHRYAEIVGKSHHSG
jgi:hypothetical protein